MAIEQIPLHCDGDPVERLLAGCMNVALKTAQEYIAVQIGNGRIVEGKNIESIVSSKLKEMGAGNLREELRKAGFTFPDDK